MARLEQRNTRAFRCGEQRPHHQRASLPQLGRRRSPVSQVTSWCYSGGSGLSNAKILSWTSRPLLFRCTPVGLVTLSKKYINSSSVCLIVALIKLEDKAPFATRAEPSPCLRLATFAFNLFTFLVASVHRVT